MKLHRAIRSGSRGVVRLGVLLGTAGEFCVRYAARRARRALSSQERAQWLHEACSTALRRLRIHTEVQGSFPSRGLLVSNHLSYLDILVYSGLFPCVFVSKKEVRSWPLFGPMARMAGSVFVDRNWVWDVPRANRAVSELLSKGAVVVLFPEGTSSDGGSVLPFRSALFDGAVRSGEPVTPAHIRYEISEGTPETDVCYWGDMTLLPHLLGMLSKGPIQAKVRIAEGLQNFNSRKHAAHASRATVLELARPSSGPSPDSPPRIPTEPDNR
jgi:lyso-ornithine lipid O-acyltransferase